MLGDKDFRYDKESVEEDEDFYIFEVKDDIVNVIKK